MADEVAELAENMKKEYSHELFEKYRDSILM